MDLLIAIGVRILETLFIVGILGSAVVLILTSFEDAKSLLPGDDKKGTETPHRSRSANVRSQFHASDPIA